MTEQNEPSMEDILASIRNILADDEEDAPKEDNTKKKTVTQNVAVTSEPVDEPEEAGDAQSEEEEVLALTEEMIVSEQKDAEPQEVFENVEEEEEEEFTPEPVIPQEPMKEETLTDLIKETATRQLTEDDEDSLLSEPTVAAAAESLAHLRNIASEKRLSLGQGNLTIEAIVRETLKPYLKEWLDIHLPEIVERIVKKEVAHVMDRLDLK